MITTQKESTDRLKTIDLFISDNGNVYADISILANCIYYCFASEDSREDGRIATDNNDLLASIGSLIEQCHEADENTSKLEIKMRLTFTSGVVTIYERNLCHLAKHITTKLSSKYDDFLFLEFFDKLL